MGSQDARRHPWPLSPLPCPCLSFPRSVLQSHSPPGTAARGHPELNAAGRLSNPSTLARGHHPPDFISQKLECCPTRGFLSVKRPEPGTQRAGPCGKCSIQQDERALSALQTLPLCGSTQQVLLSSCVSWWKICLRLQNF